MKLRITSVALAILCSTMSLAVAQEPAKKPSILVIMGDDIG